MLLLGITRFRSFLNTLKQKEYPARTPAPQRRAGSSTFVLYLILYLYLYLVLYLILSLFLILALACICLMFACICLTLACTILTLSLQHPIPILPLQNRPFNAILNPKDGAYHDRCL